MFRETVRSGKIWRYDVAVFIAAVFAVISFSIPALAQDTGQRKFKSPEDAVNALVEAARNSDIKELLAILGPEGKDIISSGDPVADEEARKRFVKAASEAMKFRKLDDKGVLAVVGKDEWSFPIPLMKVGPEWVFFTKEGKEEIINRRIGRNELNAIQISLAYVAAQREYARSDRNGDGILQYAQHFLSKNGKKDGLYWEATPEEEISPLGPLLARATEEGYAFRKGEKPVPYHGYYFKILKSQGSNAPGGELNYIVDGRMIRGFGLLAYPAEYGVSGIMSFVVNHSGVVYEKDLGSKTKEAAKAMTKYDPDKKWKKIELPPVAKGK
ncbi:MAG TPA: DUF2950 domain-containing protein [Thermodesulfovibrionales bacterium]|nr:DUF2950 domain-containing protein [Thermodesulfovibrionales bacterium]